MAAPHPTADSLSDADVRAILSGWKDLEPEHVELYVSSGVGKTLIQLERSGFQCAEGDPLLLLLPDRDNLKASVVYLRGGNYALPVGTLGHKPWPSNVEDDTPMDLLPPGVVVSPPFALGRFIKERFPTAVDKTDGTSMNMFHLPDLEVYSEICVALTSSIQFARVGAATAAMFHVPVEPVLVCAFALDKVTGRPLAQRHFTSRDDLTSICRPALRYACRFYRSCSQTNTSENNVRELKNTSSTPCLRSGSTLRFQPLQYRCTPNEAITKTCLDGRAVLKHVGLLLQLRSNLLALYRVNSRPA